MRRIVLVIGVLLGLASTNSAIASDTNAQDTIVKVEGRILPVDVIKVTSKYVKYTIPDNAEVFTMNRKEVHKIIYKSGRVEEYNKLVLVMIDEYSWQAVWLTENKEDIVDLYKRGEIKAQSPPSSRSPKAAKKSAIIRLQKKAAGKKGQVVLVTKKQATGGYGEFPGYFIEGVVYGMEPLDEESDGDEIL